MLFSPKVDLLAVGDITTDAFIRLKDAHVNCDLNSTSCTLTLKFADKVPYEFVEVVKAVGNSANAAVAAARFGLTAGLVSDVGTDENGYDCIHALKKNKVATHYISKHRHHETNYHYVLWYEAERTILVKHEEYEYAWPTVKPPKWVYLSSLASNSFDYQLDCLKFLNDHPEVKLCFQPGTFQMKLGYEKMKDFYKRSDVFVCNIEEAQRILGLATADALTLLKQMYLLGPKLILISDGPKGAYMFDGKAAYYMPIYPDPKPPYERTGCGDAFASTFICALIDGKTYEEAIMWAPINSMSVVQYVGAQKGLLSKEELKKLLDEKPAHYKPERIG